MRAQDRSRTLLAGAVWITAALGPVVLIALCDDASFGQEGPRVREVARTLHNLSAEGPGLTRSAELEEVCRACHVPHGGSDVGLLFNKPDTQAAFVPYDSPSLFAQPGLPSGVSRLCLSCHDGTVALGDLLSESQPLTFPAGREFLDPALKGLEPMLRDDHPVSFPYADALTGGNTELRAPGALPPQLPLEKGGVLGCATCHDAHDNTLGNFLRSPWEDSSLCSDCHTPHGWPLASHQQAVLPVVWQGTSTVRPTGCLACHAVHFATTPAPLLAGPGEEELCYGCHAAAGPATPVQADFQELYRHPVEQTQGIHQAREDPLTMDRHVECADCHNPHAVTATGDPLGAMAWVSGVDALGIPIDPALEPQQVCYKCHGLAPEPQEAVQRQVSGVSIRQQFGTASFSSHPVDRDTRGSSPSLLPSWQTVQRIACTDCHGGVAQGAENGRPHGSPNPFLLRRFYEIGPTGTGQAQQDAALCGRCHDLNFLMADKGLFSRHKKHVQGEKAPCATCHAPHGVPGGEINHGYLINFDLGVVQPANSGGLLYQHDPGDKARCTLKCHGQNHENKG